MSKGRLSFGLILALVAILVVIGVRIVLDRKPLTTENGGAAEPTESSPEVIQGPRWVLEMHHPGSSAALEVPADYPDAVRVKIFSAEDPTVYNVQLNMPGISVNAGESYQLDFRARADHARPIAFGVSMAHAPWSGLGFYGAVRVIEDWQAFSQTLVLDKSDTNGRLHFDLGGDAASVEFDKVVLRRLPSGEVVTQ